MGIGIELVVLIDLLLLRGPGMILATDTVQQAWQEWIGCDFEKSMEN